MIVSFPVFHFSYSYYLMFPIQTRHKFLYAPHLSKPMYSSYLSFREWQIQSKQEHILQGKIETINTIQKVLHNQSMVITSISDTAYWLLLLSKMRFWVDTKHSPPFKNTQIVHKGVKLANSVSHHA